MSDCLLLSLSWIYSSLPLNKQMLAVSATYPESLAAALTRYMREPTFVRLNPTDPSLLGEHIKALTVAWLATDDEEGTKAKILAFRMHDFS